METKQTAVWFLIKELSDKIAFTPSSELAVWHAQLYVRALQMEREQIEDAYNSARNDHHQMYFADEYFNKTYGGQDE